MKRHQACSRRLAKPICLLLRASRPLFPAIDQLSQRRFVKNTTVHLTAGFLCAMGRVVRNGAESLAVVPVSGFVLSGSREGQYPYRVEPEGLPFYSKGSVRGFPSGSEDEEFVALELADEISQT